MRAYAVITAAVVLAITGCAAGAPSQSGSPPPSPIPTSTQPSPSPSPAATQSATPAPAPAITPSPPALAPSPPPATAESPLPDCGLPGAPDRDLRALTDEDLAAIEAAFGFALTGTPTCGYLDETTQTERSRGVFYIQLGGQQEALDDLARRFIDEGWNALGSEGPPVYERNGVEVGFVFTPPGIFVSLP